MKQFNSVTQSCLTLCDPMDYSTPGFPAHHQLPGLAQVTSNESVIHPTISSTVVPFSSCLQSFPASASFPGLHITWPKYWSFSFSISPSNEYSEQISFRIDWFDLAVQGTLKSLLQCVSLKASILQHSPFFMVQLTSVHDHWKNHSFD